MKKNWNITIDGIEHNVYYEFKSFSGKQKLIIDGEQVSLPKKHWQAFTGLEKMIMIGEKECQFVMLGNKTDIAVDGVFVNSGKPYSPLKKVAWWAWIFIALSIAIRIIMGGGAIPVVLGLLSATFCCRISVSPYLKTVAKVFSCLGITALAYGLAFAVALLFTILSMLL